MVTAAGSNFNILYALRCFGKRAVPGGLFSYFLSELLEADSVFAFVSFFVESLLLSDSDFELDPADDFLA